MNPLPEQKSISTMKMVKAHSMGNRFRAATVPIPQTTTAPQIPSAFATRLIAEPAGPGGSE